ncbi:MAG: hypothetical protein JOY64_14385 [Alphaproteobacteria bacterium]|nr:hypothetical protein [Alphaproteobacteria bacterium]MBV8408818.1 hypothetical protein [Alphaproteobacteria bacterium]
MEWRSDRRLSATGKRIGEQFGNDGPHGSAFPLMDGLDLFQDRILDIERGSHDA